nr:hypothetical protein [Sedimentibacter sp.]
MRKYNSINELLTYVENEKIIICDEFSEELVHLLKILEKVNPCSQQYELIDNTVIISYYLKINLFNFANLFPLNVKVQVIGLPVSVSEKGYFGEQHIVQKAIGRRKGLKILLNGNSEFENGGRTLSTFVFENKFTSFDRYIDSLRSPYRRRIKKALSHRNEIDIRKFDNVNFNKNHYELYLSIMKRTDNPLETLPIEFFINYDAELYEFMDAKTKEIIGFVQIKEIKNKLLFLFGGFRKEDNSKYDTYYNMLTKIIEIGIEKKVECIEFGQTAEECKMKIGCKEIPKYMYVHHSNPVLNRIIQLLVPMFSYRPYGIKHHVFKQNCDEEEC